nr:MAG TPA: hypothetical protein [Crassvirales sp.]
MVYLQFPQINSHDLHEQTVLNMWVSPLVAVVARILAMQVPNYKPLVAVVAELPLVLLPIVKGSYCYKLFAFFSILPAFFFLQYPK